MIKELGAEDALVALESIVSNFDEIQTKGIGRRISRAARGGPNAGRFVQRDGDGDGKFSLTPGAPDETPISKLPKRGVPNKPRVYDGSGASPGVFPGRARDRDFEKRREELSRSLRDAVERQPFDGRNSPRSRRAREEAEASVRARELIDESRSNSRSSASSRRAEEAAKPGAPVRRRRIKSRSLKEELETYRDEVKPSNLSPRTAH